MISPLKHLGVTLIYVIVLFIVALPGCTPPQQPKFGFNPVLSISAPPDLGKPVKVTLTFTPQKGFDTYAARINLTPGVGLFEVVQGDLERDGISGATPPLEVTIRSIRTGMSGVIVGEVRGMTPHVTPWEYHYLFITITEGGATVSETQPKGAGTPLAKMTPIETFTPTPTPAGIPPPSTTIVSPSPAPSSKIITPGPAPTLKGGARSPQEPKPGFNPVLSISAPPALGKPVEVTLTFTGVTPKGLGNRELYYTARIELHPGVYEVVEGGLEQKGRISPGVHTLKATIRSVTTTASAIYGRVAMRLSPDAVWGTSEYDVIFIAIAEDKATVSKTQPANNLGGYPVYDGDQPKKLITIIPYDKAAPPPKTLPIPSKTPKPSGLSASFVHSLTIQGKFNAYISKNIPGQKTQDELKPIVWGLVEIFDMEDNPLGSGLTGSGHGQPSGQNAGEYSITVENPYPLGFKVRITPESGAAVILSNLLNNHYYADYYYGPVEYTQPLRVCPDETPSDNHGPDYLGAWRIYETLVNDDYDRGAWNFLVNSGRGPHYTPPAATVYYPVDPVPLGPPNPPFYDAWSTFSIYLDQDNQTKGLDTVQHEYGHFIMHAQMYGYNILSPIQPANHYTWQTYNAEIAWTEGWANFFAMVVQDDPILFDDAGSGDLENKDLNSQGWRYDGQQWVWGDCDDGDTVEGRVAGALWDIYDSNNDNYDTISAGFGEIWQAFVGSPSNVRTFAGFWNQLKLGFTDQVPPARALFQNTIAYPELRLYLTATVLPVASGTVTFDPSGGSYSRNQSVTLTANPATGRQFYRWTGELSGSNNPAAVTMDFDRTVVANFLWPPSVTTDAASSVGTTSATLNGNLTSLGGSLSAVVSFEWGTTTNYGTPTTGQPLGATGSFHADLTGLSPGTTYHFRAKAEGDATVYGGDQSFTTKTPPVVSTNAASAVTVNSATLNGNLDSLGTATPVYVSFVYGPNPSSTYPYSYPNETLPAQSMNAIGQFPANIFGLDSGRLYYFRAKAVGAATVFGAELTFTTKTPPTVTTVAATSIGVRSATLNGQLDSLGTASPVNVSFEYGTTDSYGSETAAQQMTSPGVFTTGIAGLTPGTLYHFRAKAVGDGTARGEDRTFTTIVPPSGSTSPATGITVSSAIGNGNLTSLGSATSVNVSFQYGPTDSYGSEAVPQQMTSPGPFTGSMTGLTQGTLYHFRAKMVGQGTTYGGDQQFTTLVATPPAVTTSAASNITVNSATLNGNLTSLGSAATVNVYFEYGLTTSYGSATTSQPMTATGTFSDSIAGLNGVTAYHFRAKAVGAGAVVGGDGQFATNATIAASAGANGTISPSGTVLVTYGSNQTFDIGPAAGYHVADVVVDGVSQGAITTYTFLNVTSNHTISATFVINPTITTSSLPNGDVGVYYTARLDASGGAGAYAWSVPPPGSLPAGLSLDSSLGVIHGNPAAAGPSSFTIMVTDSLGGTATRTFTPTFNVSPSIAPASLADGNVGAAYSQTLTVSGGTSPYTWTRSSGSLPPGLSLNPSSGVISGTPTGAGAFNFTVVLADLVGGATARSFTIAVNPAATLSSAKQAMWLFEAIRGLGTNLKPGSLAVQSGGAVARRTYIKVTSPGDPTHLVMFGIERSSAYPNSAIFYYDSNEAGYTYLPDTVDPEVFRNYGVYITDILDQGQGYRYQLWVDGQLKRDNLHVPARDQVFEQVSEAWGAGGAYTVESSPSVFRDPILYKQNWAEWWDPYQPTRWYFNDPYSSHKPPIWETHYQDPWAFRYETKVLNLGYQKQTTSPDYAGIIGYLRPGTLNTGSSQLERHYAAAVVGQMTGASTDSYVMVGVVRTNDNQQWRFFTYDNDDGAGYLYHGTADPSAFNYFAVNLFGSFVEPWGYEYWVVINGNAVRYGRLRTPDPASTATYVSVEDQLWTAAANFAGAEDTQMADFKSPQLLLTWYGGIQDWNSAVATVADSAPATQPVTALKWQDPSDSNRYRFQFAVDTASQPYYAGSSSKQIANFGGRATIGWRNPAVVDSDSEEWIMSGLSPETNRYLQIGWRKDIRSPSAWASPKAWLRYVDAATGEPVDRYSPLDIPSGDVITPLLYYSEDADSWLCQVSAPHWASAWNPETIPWPTVGFRQATRFQASGETWWLSDQIAGTGQPNAVEFHDITYFVQPGQQGPGSPGFTTQDYSASDPAYGVEGIAPTERNFRNWSNP